MAMAMAKVDMAITINRETPASFLSMHSLIEARHRIQQDWFRAILHDLQGRVNIYANHLGW